MRSFFSISFRPAASASRLVAKVLFDHDGISVNGAHLHCHTALSFRPPAETCIFCTCGFISFAPWFNLLTTRNTRSASRGTG